MHEVAKIRNLPVDAQGGGNFALICQSIDGCTKGQICPDFPGDGSGGDSIYGGKFNDEKAGLKLRHDAHGTLSMANSGKNSNTSQFYITLADALPQLDGKHVVFGRVVGGLELLKRIGELCTPSGSYRKGFLSSDIQVH